MTGGSGSYGAGSAGGKEMRSWLFLPGFLGGGLGSLVLEVGGYGLNGINYQISSRLGQFIGLDEVKFKPRVAKGAFLAIVHILEQAGQVPEVWPLHAEVICQAVQGKQGGHVLAAEQVIDGSRAQAGIDR